MSSYSSTCRGAGGPKSLAACGTACAQAAPRCGRDARPAHLRQAGAGPARGTVLVLVLLVVAVLTIVAASQLFTTRSELGAATAAHRSYQARAAALSGIHRAMTLLWNEPNNVEARTDTPDIFQAQQVSAAESADPWYFTVFAPNFDDPQHVRYGLEDESGKINLANARPAMLLALPGMTPELVDCLLDYRDADSETRPQGAEQEYYDGLPTPYLVRNAPPATVEELLLIKGFNGTILYGEDANRNGLLDPNEDDGDDGFPPDNRDGQLDCGLWPLVTVGSYEPNVSRDGQRRLNISSGSPRAVFNRLTGAGLPEPVAAIAAAARLAGQRLTDPSQLLGLELDVPDPRTGRPVHLVSPVDAANLPEVMDKLTTGGEAGPDGQEILRGRVNISSAPRAVLAVLPGLNEELAQRIVDMRGGLEEQTGSTTAWLLTQNVVSAEVFKQVAPLVTVRSYQFRVRSIGYSNGGGQFCMLEAVVDLASGKPRIVYLRDVTKLGVPFSLAGMERQ